MVSGMGPQPQLPEAEPHALAVRLLTRARLAAYAAFAGDLVLLGLFLWGVNPNNLFYSAVVLAQSGPLVASVAVALLLPVLTVVWVGWMLQSARDGDWGPARRLLPAIVALGYFALIGPGYYLHETLHLLDSPVWSRRAPTGSPSPH